MAAVLTQTMADSRPPRPISYHTNRGIISYTPAYRTFTHKPSITRLPDPPCRPRQRRPHSIHITRLPPGYVPLDLRPKPPSPPPKNPKRNSGFRVELGKLASRDNAKRLLGSVFPSLSSPSPSASSSAAVSTRSVSTEISTPRPSFAAASTDPSTLLSRRSVSSAAAVGDQAMSRPPLITNINGHTSRPNSVNASAFMPAKQECEKPIASGNGVTVSIILAEPVIFLTGLDHDGTTRDSGSNTSSILRGKLQLNVTKSVKIKSVTLTFTGKARTEWPEGNSISIRSMLLFRNSDALQAFHRKRHKSLKKTLCEHKSYPSSMLCTMDLMSAMVHNAIMP